MRRLMRKAKVTVYYCPDDGTELDYRGYYHCPLCDRAVDVKDLRSSPEPTAPEGRLF